MTISEIIFAITTSLVTVYCTPIQLLNLVVHLSTHAWRTSDQESDQCVVLLPKKWVKTLLSSSPRVPVGTPTGTWDVAASERTGGSD